MQDKFWVEKTARSWKSEDARCLLISFVIAMSDLSHCFGVHYGAHTKNEFVDYVHKKLIKFTGMTSFLQDTQVHNYHMKEGGKILLLRPSRGRGLNTWSPPSLFVSFHIKKYQITDYVHNSVNSHNLWTLFFLFLDEPIKELVAPNLKMKSAIKDGKRSAIFSLYQTPKLNIERAPTLLLEARQPCNLTR